MIKVENLYIKEIDFLINYTFKNRINYIYADNGSGKTLLLDYIGGLRVAKNDSINYHDKSLIYMRQNFFFNSRITVYEYLTFIKKLNKETIDDFLSFLDLYQINFPYEKIKNKKLGLLSGGEKQLLYVLSVLSIERDWYILDEPINSIDQNRSAILIELIKDMSYDNKSFILTSHTPINLADMKKILFSDLTSNSNE